MPAEPIVFWIVAASLSAFVLAMLLPALLGWRRTPSGGSLAELNTTVHREELAEIDEALRCGALSAQEHRSRADEVLCRVLQEVAAPEARASGLVSRAGLAGVIAVPIAAIGLYLAIGDPGALAEVAAEPQASALERHLERSPRDGRAWIMFARERANEDRFVEAAQAYERALAVSDKIARDPQIWCELADALGMAQGSLKGRPRELIGRALALDPAHALALEMAGSAALESFDYAAAVAYWERLLDQVREPGERTKLELALQNLRAMKREVKLPVSPTPPAAPATPAPSPRARG